MKLKFPGTTVRVNVATQLFAWRTVTVTTDDPVNKPITMHTVQLAMEAQLDLGEEEYITQLDFYHSHSDPEEDELEDADGNEEDDEDRENLL